MAFLLLHTFTLSCSLRGFLATRRILLVINALKEEGWGIFSVFVMKLYGFCLSIAYVHCASVSILHGESTDSLIM